jgi:protease YdgD
MPIKTAGVTRDLALVLTLVVSWWVQQAHADTQALSGIFGRDDRIDVDSTAWPWQAIGLVQRKIGGGCTGTLIALKVVLTAAHCLFDQRTGRPLQAAEVRFLAGYREGQFIASSLGAGIVRISDRHAQRAPVINDMATDWVLVVLRDAIPVRPIPLRPLPKGAGKPGTPGEVSVARAGYSEDRPTILSVDLDCSILHRDPAGRFLFTDCDTLKGDSGSPLLQGEGKAVTVVGVTSGLIAADNGHRGSVIVYAESILPRVAGLKVPGTDTPILPAGELIAD